jgi:lambda family phage portal protein
MKFKDRFRIARKFLAGNWNWKGGTNSGYLFNGSKFNGSTYYPSGWGLDHTSLRDKSRAAYWDSTQARSILKRLVDNANGTGLVFESSPIWQYLNPGLTDKEKHNKAKDIELRFHLWANSKESDASGKMSFYELQSHEFLNRLRDGETFEILRYSNDSKRMSPLSIQFINPEQVQSPTDQASRDAANSSGNRIIDGIEINSAGKEIAIHIIDENYKSTRVPFSGNNSGRIFVLHPFIADNLGSIRGTPLLSSMVHELQKITDGTVAELEAMVLNAIMAIWVKPSADARASHALAGVQAIRNQNTETKNENVDKNTAVFDKPGLIIQSLQAGEEVQSFDTKRPNVNFPNFIREITKYLSSSAGVPIEILELLFTNNYSASRAALLLFWKTIEIWREHSISQFLMPVFEAWFTEEVRAGRIIADNFDSSPIIRAAWLNGTFNGDKQPSIDPQKEAAADDLRINQGATTRERTAMEYNGSDYMDNVRKLKQENILLKEAQGGIE